jgi:hypothetical protein
MVASMAVMRSREVTTRTELSWAAVYNSVRWGCMYPSASMTATTLVALALVRDYDIRELNGVDEAGAVLSNVDKVAVLPSGAVVA